MPGSGCGSDRTPPLNNRWKTFASRSAARLVGWGIGRSGTHLKPAGNGLGKWQLSLSDILKAAIPLAAQFRSLVGAFESTPEG
jgi:hypothetical protein